MLMRNLNIREGLYNGTRLIIDDIINDRLLKATIANGEFKGRQVLIPKINTEPDDESFFGFEWRRTQFLVEVAFSTTINKSQGQTLRNVAVWLQEPCFGHGQLYVAASRVGDSENIKLYIMRPEGQPHYVTKNVVYRELLQWLAYWIVSDVKYTLSLQKLREINISLNCCDPPFFVSIVSRGPWFWESLRGTSCNIWHREHIFMSLVIYLTISAKSLNDIS